MTLDAAARNKLFAAIDAFEAAVTRSVFAGMEGAEQWTASLGEREARRADLCRAINEMEIIAAARASGGKRVCRSCGAKESEVIPAIGAYAKDGHVIPGSVPDVCGPLEYRSTPSPDADVVALEALQARIAEWHDRNFGDAPQIARALIICEEVGELAHVVLKQTQGIRPETSTDAHLRDAMGDIVIALCALAASRGWSLWECVTETAETVLARDWVAQRAAYASPTAEGEA